MGFSKYIEYLISYNKNVPNDSIAGFINTVGTTNINATTIGNNCNQHKVISWSYLNLGKVALTNTNKKQNKQVFKPKNIDCKLINVSFINNSGKLNPPKNNMAEILLNKTIELYSAKKKNTNMIELCSVKKPATNSDSASCRSKGVLDDSANIDIK